MKDPSDEYHYILSDYMYSLKMHQLQNRLMIHPSIIKHNRFALPKFHDEDGVVKLINKICIRFVLTENITITQLKKWS